MRLLKHIYCFYTNVLYVVNFNMIFVYLAGYNRGSYNQNRWGNSYRDGGSDSRSSGYNRSQQSGGTYNRSAPYSKGAYNQVLTHLEKFNN